ncbi:MAG: fasciclin domain-containing protein [Chloroflexi bacterium]|nr:fasciclin domain-containing protein [Chloroflexota bacterium]
MFANVRPTATPVPALVPPAEEDIETLLDLAWRDPRLSEFASLVEGTELGARLDAPGSYTLLVPTNEAWGAMTEEQRRSLADPGLRERLLGHHVLPTKVLEPDLILLEKLDPLVGPPIRVHIDMLISEEECCGLTYIRYVDGGAMISSPIEADNGLLYVIDAVLWPEGADISTP